ncbi:hypothetical protein F5Y11DRAFT_133476 [Daldinia sp. FL1419]|nr:hypothetical protein F5Y11DRAFT_133476 [Daldinia sp. FL1419]
MTKHYPLNGIDLDFDKYEHRPISNRDIIVNRILREYMFPKKVKAAIYDKRSDQDAEFHQIKSRDRELGLDMQVLSRMLKTDYNSSFIDLQRLYFYPTTIFLDILNYYNLAEPRAMLGKVILGLIERYYLESEPCMGAWLGYLTRFRPDIAATQKSSWAKATKEHLKNYRPAPRKNNCSPLFSGRHHPRTSALSNVEFCIDPQFITAQWLGIYKLPLQPPNRPQTHNYSRVTVESFSPVNTACVSRGRPRRSRSMPLLDSWSTAALDIKDKNLQDKWIIHFPRRPLSELDKLSRRRSLSRSHIRAMFTDKPKIFEKRPARKKAQGEVQKPCANCSQNTSHRPSTCPSKCGYCNSPSHKAFVCPTKARNRCKCSPFPQYHTAFECHINCSRRCGAPSPPSQGHHKNAMLCTYRCCMCGAKGHSGRECSLKKCPCGGKHLTQDCRWKVECPAKDCNFYLCHLHCRECGKKKSKKCQFIGKTCQDCLRNSIPVSGKITSG